MGFRDDVYKLRELARSGQRPRYAIGDLFKQEDIYRLGQLTHLVAQVANVQGRTDPEFVNPQLIIFAADTGVVLAHSTADWESCTSCLEEIARRQQLVNTLCENNGVALRLVDVGLKEAPQSRLGIVGESVGAGTGDYSRVPSMTEAQLDMAFSAGMRMVEQANRAGSKVVALGFVARGARLTSAIWTRVQHQIPLSETIEEVNLRGWTGGRYTIEGLETMLGSEPLPKSEYELMSRYGGFELAAAVGAILYAGAVGLVVLVDSIVGLAAYSLAVSLVPEVEDNVILAHMEANVGMERLAKMLGKAPIVRLGLYAAEGIGALSAYPILKSAIGLRSIAHAKSTDKTQ